MYRSLLEGLLGAVRGADAALLLDKEGEVVVHAGDTEERHRLIGAYQGLALASLQKITERYELGGLDYLVRRHVFGTVILRPLKDGYYLVVSLAPTVPIGPGLHQSALTGDRINAEL
jgi:predicted regulator of Ras-like GTPase activity (Roadblock/LC7/MglB family)